jgi:ribose 5-phosphate isomerase B
MDIYLGADHGGFARKQDIAEYLTHEGYDVHDCGPHDVNPTDDYPIYAWKVARAVCELPGSYGILICRSGEGMAMAANRMRGIRAAVIWNATVARESRADNDANIAVIPADFLSSDEIIQCIRQFLTTSFSGAERHKRRIELLEKGPDGN